MKGQTVGATGLLWPSDKAMLDLREISCQDYILEETTPLDLLWPASLINELGNTTCDICVYFKHNCRIHYRPIANDLGSRYLRLQLGYYSLLS